jgi:maltose acetyltransferase-like protein
MPRREKEKMVIGKLYRSTDPELQAAAAQAQQHLRRLNEMSNNEDAELRRMGLEALLGSVGESTQIKSLSVATMVGTSTSAGTDLSTTDAFS